MQTSNDKKITKQYLKPYIGNIVLYFVLMCMATAFSIASILSISNFLQILFGTQLEQTANPSELEKILNSIYSYFIAFGKEKALWIFAGLIFGIYFLKDLFTYLASYFVVSTRAKIVRNMRNDLIKSYTNQSIAFMNRYKKGDLISRLSADLVEYDQNVLQGLQSLVSVVINVVLYFAVLLYMNFSLTLTSLVVVPVIGAVVSFISRKLRRSSKQMQQESAELISRLEETISGLRIIKSHTAIDFVCKGFAKFNSSYTRLRTKIYRKVDLASPQSEFFGNCMVIGILLLGTTYIVSTPPQMSADFFIVYLIIFTLIIKPAKDFSTSLYNIKKGQAAEYRIAEIICAERVTENENTDFKLEEKIDSIEVKNLSFAYNQTDVLKNINLKFEKGKPTAVVGPSGAGKSTLIDLLLKFYTPSKGDITYNSASVSDIPGVEIRNHIAIVSQDTVLFNDTVIDNLKFGNENCNEEDVIQAAKIAKADEFISEMERGYQTRLGDGGNTLSGGQKQRLSIARAVLKNADVLILDEATSALDTVSEKYIQQAIDELSKDKIIISIAHRLSSIKHFPNIVVLNGGELVEKGTHQELIELNGLYASLCSMQQMKSEA